MFSKVIVGVDGRDGGRDAGALATALVEPHGEVLLVSAWATPLRPPGVRLGPRGGGRVTALGAPSR